MVCQRAVFSMKGTLGTRSFSMAEGLASIMKNGSSQRANVVGKGVSRDSVSAEKIRKQRKQQNNKRNGNREVAKH